MRENTNSINVSLRQNKHRKNALFFLSRSPCAEPHGLSLHSHKKQKDSLETRAEWAVLRAYVENHAILEPILLYRASKYKQTKRPGY